MTKKKKTLRAAVLASIFAMAFSATAWADVWGEDLDGSKTGTNGATGTEAAPGIPDYTEFVPPEIPKDDELDDNQKWWDKISAYNPTLTSQNGSAAVNGTVVENGPFGNGKYSPQYNYYLQSYAYGKNSGGAGSELLVERIVGVKMNESAITTTSLKDYGIEQDINVQGVQFFHVEYVEEDFEIKDANGNVIRKYTKGEVLSPDGIDVSDGKISLKAEVNGTSHYCGESAKSISIGQIQRALEVFYANDNSLTQAILSEARLRDSIKLEKVVGEGIIDGSQYKFYDDNGEATLIDIGKYVTQNAGDALYYKDDSKTITINQAITNNATEAKKHTTVENGLNIVITEATNDDGGKHYKVSTATEVNFDKVTSDVVIAPELHSDIGVIKKVISEAVHSDMAMIGGKVKIDETGVTMNSTDIIGANNVDTNSITLGDSSTTKITYDGSRITYNNGAESIANLNDGMKYGADNTTSDNSNVIDLNLNQQLNINGMDNKNIYTEADGNNSIRVMLDTTLEGLVEVNSTTINSKTVNTQDINVSNVVKVGDNVTINSNGLTIEGDTTNVVINETKVDVGGNKIENVAPGELSPDSQDAVNGSQLFNTNQKLDRLGNRVDKVGAGAAALAALHPLDFDPDDKLSFSAGVGNYGSETATALGAFYRPSEKVMLSAAGTMGNGENMVNLGVTFALDKTNNVSNSRVAMAREIQDLKSHIVKQDAQIAELMALVGQLTGKSIGQSEDSIMFPDVPENHWAYDYIEGLQKRGIVEGYPDGNFGGDRSMTRYEYAAMLYRALEKGFPVDSRLLDEFDAELGRIRIDRIKGLDDDGNKIERVRVNQYEGRDDYGSKLTTVNEAE